MKRRNPFPGVTRVEDRHGKIRYRFRRKGFSCYLPGPYGSVEFRQAYDEAMKGSTQLTGGNTAPHGTISWLIAQYLRSAKFANLSQARRKTISRELDWLDRQAGKYQFARLGVRHVEAIMAKKDGPAAANAVKKNMSMLYNFASKKLDYRGTNPARYAEKRKTNPDGYHTWTDAEVDRFLERHGPGTKARFVMLLALNTGMARQDLAKVGWQHVSHREGRDRIAYRRGKTAVAADMPVMPELAEELQHVSRDRLLFITQDKQDAPYTVESLGNWFRDRCAEAKVPGSLHGLRKAGATRLADAGATEWEIASYLAHTDTSQAAVYVKKANRSRLADSGFEKLTGRGNVSNLPNKLDKGGS